MARSPYWTCAVWFFGFICLLALVTIFLLPPDLKRFVLYYPFCRSVKMHATQTAPGSGLFANFGIPNLSPAEALFRPTFFTNCLLWGRRGPHLGSINQSINQRLYFTSNQLGLFIVAKIVPYGPRTMLTILSTG